MSPGTTYLRRAVASAVLVAVIFAFAPERAATQGRALFPETSSLFVERSVTGSYRLALPEGYVDLTESGIGWFRYETSSQTGLHLSWKLVGMQTQSRWMIGGGAADDPQLTRIDASGSQRLRAGRSAVRAGILPGIDLHIASVANGQQGGEGLFKYSFLVAPRVDPGSIVIDADAGVRPHRDDQGRLLFTTPLGTITEDPPVGWQNVDGVRRYVPIAFVVDGQGLVRFEIGEYDTSLPLVIDPLVRFSSYVGGARLDEGRGVVTATDGSIVMTARSLSLDFPTTPGVFRDRRDSLGGDVDIVVSRFDPTGRRLLWSTWIVGSDADDPIGGPAVLPDGRVVVGGVTTSTTFPQVGVPLAPTAAGESDGFLCVLSADGSELDYSSYLGGENADSVWVIKVDAGGRIVLLGTSRSSTLALPSGGFQPSTGGGVDLFVAAFASDLTGLDAGTWLGGVGDEEGADLALDGARITVVGMSDRDDWPVTADALEGAPLGGRDIVVAELSGDLTQLRWASYFGGSGDDAAGGVARDINGNLLVTGSSSSVDFPDNVNIVSGGSWFVSRIGDASHALDYSLILSNDNLSAGVDVIDDEVGRPLLVGRTTSRFFPTGFPAERRGPRGATDLAMIRLRADGSGIDAALVLGGSADEAPVAPIARGIDGTLIAVGTTLSSDFHLSRFPFDPAFNANGEAGEPDAFLVGWDFEARPHLTGPGLFILDTLDCDTEGIDTLWVHNDGDASATIEANFLEVSEGPYRLLEPADLTSIVVAPGDSVRYIVSFSSREARTEPNAILVYSTDSIGGRSPLRIGLSGDRNAPAIVGADLRFGNIPTCRDSVLTLTLFNAWAGRVTVRQPTFAIGDGSFTIEPGTTFPLSIDERDSRQIRVRFTPTDAQGYLDTLRFSLDECPSSQLDVELRGRGEIASATIPVDTIDFGMLDGCQSSVDTIIRVPNDGSLDLIASDFALPGSDFRLIAPSTDTSFSPGGELGLMIGFTPTGTGSRSSVLSFLTSPCDTLRRIVLRGGRSGVIPPILTQDSIDFGRITACAGLPQSRDSTIRIVNNGTEDVVLGGLETPTPFRFCGLQAPTLIPAGDSVSLCIGFSPTGEGTFRRIVSLPYRQGACRDTLRLVVTGELVAPLLSTDSLRIDVGSIGPCSIIDTIGVLLRNRSAIGITVDSVDGGESIEPIDFDAPLGIGADDSTRLKLRLRPRAAGPFSYPVHFFYGPCGDTLTIIIEGEAIGIVPLLEKERIDFGKILACSPPQLLRDTTRLLLSGGAGEVTVTSARLIADSGRISVEGLEDFAGQTVGSSGLTIPVTFADSSFRISHDTLEIVLAPCGDTILLPIVAEAVFPALAITSGQFGQVEVDAERALPIVVENISGVPLEVTIEHLPPEPYRVDTTGLNLPRILAPGEFVALPSRLAPTRSGFYTDSIGLSVAQGCSYRRTIRLDGEGTNPVVTGTFCLRGLHGQQSRSGDTVEVPITGGGGIQTGEPVDVLFDVVYDPMRVEMLSPLVGSLSDDDPATGRATVEILGATTFPDDLPVLRLRLLAGERPFTTIALDSVRLVGGSALRPLVCDTLAVVGIGHRCIVSGVSLGRFATRLRPIRPNPVRGQLTLSFDQLEDIRTAVVIVDGTGREVLRPLDAEMLGGSYELLVDVTELPAGLYFVRLTSGSFDEVERFVVPD